ncbi:MAG: P1 family peptidase [Pseudomonadota bacterium]
MASPGLRNALTDVEGLTVGNAEDQAVRTGVTVVLADRPMVASVDVRGAAPGTRDTDLLCPSRVSAGVDALVFSGGSEFGLEAASGVCAVLSTHGRGVEAGPVPIPIVPSAILFDLAFGGDKAWGTTPPYRDLGIRALEAAGPDFALGNSGAGLGAKAGGLKGGLGTASIVDPITGATVAALTAANPHGSAVIPGSDTLWAWTLEQNGELGGQSAPAGPISPDADAGFQSPLAKIGANTILGVVATDADLSKAEAHRLAVMAHDGFARAVRPSHSPFDGDALFALATGSLPIGGDDRPRKLGRLGTFGADVVARSIARAVYEAESLGQFRSYRSVHGAGLRAGKNG